MHSSHKKIIASVSLLLVAVLVITTISISHIHTVSAQPSFQGIQTIVADNTVDTPFSVVELVPKTDMAAFGYLVDGNEPVAGVDASTGKAVLWQDAIKLISGTAGRTSWMEEQQDKFKNICGTDKALTYIPYEETYVVAEDDEANWTKVTLTTEDVLAAETAGYRMEDVGDDHGAYILTESYALSDAQNGDYDENPDYFVYADGGNHGYYSLGFAVISGTKSAETVEDLQALVGDKGAYAVTSATIYTSEDAFADFRANEANHKYAIYAVPRSDLSSNFTYIGLAGEVKLSRDVDTGEGGDTGDSGNTGEGGDTGDSGNTGEGGDTESGTGTDESGENTASGTEDDAADTQDAEGEENVDTGAGTEEGSGTGEGGNTGNGEGAEEGGNTGTGEGTEEGGTTEADPLLLDFGNYWYYTVSFAHVPTDKLETGNYYYSVIPAKTVFNRSQDAEYGSVLNVAHPYVKNENKTGNFVCTSAPAYVYVGEWNGRYTLVADTAGKLDHEAKIPYYYYKGGFSSNNLFKNQVFNQDGSLDAKNMFFDVTTVTPDSFEDYLENKSASEIDLLFISGSSSSFAAGAAFDTSDDIKKSTAEDIIKQVYDTGIYMPVIADYSIIASEVNDSGKLSKGADFGTASDVTNVQRLAALLCASNFSTVITDVSAFDLDSVAWDQLTFLKDADNHYVNKNIYVIPGNTSGRIPFILSDISETFISGGNDTDFENNAKNTGFDELASYIVNENFIRQAESAGAEHSYELFERKVTKAIAIEYCISYLQKRQQSVKHDIHVLDIEPRQTDSYYNPDLQAAMKKWFTDAGFQVDSLTVTTIPMAEFIGRIDDLADYDMIYFGLNTDYFNKSGAMTVYNDVAMNGLIYSNVGDISVVNSNGSIGQKWPWSYSGLLESDYKHTLNNATGLLERLSVITAESKSGSDKKSVLDEGNRTETFRLSGNDLTKQKYNEIIDYIKGGFPVVFADGFMDAGSVNELTIDDCTYIYELIKDQLAKENVMTETDAKSHIAKLYRYVSLNKPVVSVSGLTKTSGKEYVTLNSSKINFSFQIENLSAAEGESEFDCVFYFDNNADGRFSATESVVASDLTISQNGKRIKPKDGHYSLKAGTDITYSLSYYLPDSYIGIIPWKLKICQTDNEYRYDSVQGYFYKKNTGGKQVVNILQINTKNGAQQASSLNMQQEMNKNSTFRKLVESLEDFTLNIKTISGDAYTNSYEERDGVAYVTVDGSQVRLDSFDMLVLGFADVYSLDDGTKNCYKGLQDYIDAGKPVLCTHDTTSPSNDSTAKYWGYDYNTLLRNYVGMDRYGILTNKALKLGLELDSTSDQEACLVESSGTGTDKFYIVRNSDGTYSYSKNANKATTIRQLFADAVDAAAANDTDIAYKPRSGKKEIVKQNQGMTDLSLMYQAYGSSNSTNRAQDYINYASNPKLTKNCWQTTTTAVRVNEGQITTYPFVIGNKLTVSSTHYQYYQLDMNEDEDNDGESDIVVWYTLSGSTADNSLYTTAEKDVRNNYYIYTKGNITYSGVGHSNVNSENELKLYINTMIAAYSTGLNTPTVSIRQGIDEDAPAVDTIYLSYDARQDVILEEELGRDYTNPVRQKFYFTVNDSNLIKNMRSKEEFVDFYIEVTKAEYDANRYWGSYIEHDGIYLKKQNWTVYAADGSALSTTNNAEGIKNGWYDASSGKYHLVSGTTYCVDLDINSLISAASYNGQQFKNSTRAIKVYIGAYTKITYNNYASTVTDTDISYYGFEIRQLELVDLD
ncbi:MAG: DUF5057 domain-containing protein [Agathobacter sp.]|nr:DUF5057 domain-containing protein [Agathobacter sp.]